jgi:hypothetical protein
MQLLGITNPVPIYPPNTSVSGIIGGLYGPPIIITLFFYILAVWWYLTVFHVF